MFAFQAVLSSSLSTRGTLEKIFGSQGTPSKVGSFWSMGIMLLILAVSGKNVSPELVVSGKNVHLTVVVRIPLYGGGQHTNLTCS